MKKIFSILLIGITLCTTFACSGQQPNSENNASQEEELEQQQQEQQQTQVQIKQYKVNYNLNGGINSNLNVEILNEGEDLTLIAPEKYAYIFKGWYTDKEFANKIEKINDISSNVDLFAKWEINEEYYEGFPVIHINTQDNVLPYDKETYINASFKIENCEDEEDNFEVTMKSEYGEKDSIGIRLRGNSTRNLPKKPYRIKFDKKKSLFGLEANKSWVLLADYLDTSAIRNYAAFSLAQELEYLDFSPNPHHVVLFLNNEYKGLYLLTEQMDEKEGRANVEEDFDPAIDTSFPFLVEMDENALLEGITGVDNFQPKYYEPIEIKYPESDERGLDEGEEDVVFEYIKNYINAAFTALKTHSKVEFDGELVSFEDLVDVDSFLEYWLINEIMRNEDSTYKSIYMSKTKDGKLKFGPVWDFDWSMSDIFENKPYDKSEIETAYDLCILKYDTPLKEFITEEENFQLLVNKWNEIKHEILELSEDLREYKYKLSQVAKYDALYWYGDNGAILFDAQYDYVRLYLNDRYNFLDNYFNNRD